MTGFSARSIIIFALGALSLSSAAQDDFVLVQEVPRRLVHVELHRSPGRVTVADPLEIQVLVKVPLQELESSLASAQDTLYRPEPLFATWESLPLLSLQHIRPLPPILLDDSKQFAWWLTLSADAPGSYSLPELTIVHWPSSQPSTPLTTTLAPIPFEVASLLPGDASGTEPMPLFEELPRQAPSWRLVLFLAGLSASGIGLAVYLLVYHLRCPAVLTSSAQHPGDSLHLERVDALQSATEALNFLDEWFPGTTRPELLVLRQDLEQYAFGRYENELPNDLRETLRAQLLES